ncbi:hypothetical protein CN327_17675 [Bacillus cereus]|nr:hypothetical protein CN327_17675 [Bacillus cereus]
MRLFRIYILVTSGGTLEVQLSDDKLLEFKEWLESESSQLFTIEVDKHREINRCNCRGSLTGLPFLYL